MKTRKDENGNDINYLNSKDWAILSAALWLQPDLNDAFQKDPVRAVIAAQNSGALKFADGYVYTFEGADGRRDRLIEIPANPGYSFDELNDACLGKVSIVPMTSWTVCGT